MDYLFSKEFVLFFVGNAIFLKAIAVIIIYEILPYDIIPAQLFRINRICWWYPSDFGGSGVRAWESWVAILSQQLMIKNIYIFDILVTMHNIDYIEGRTMY